MRFACPVFLLFIVVISSCTNPAQQDQPAVYYDVAGFIKQQITDLSVNKPTVHKTTQFSNMFDPENQSTRDINWARELELFGQADINKPALRSSYQISRPDSLTYQYTLKPTEERLTVRSLTVWLDSVGRQPSRIEAVLQTNNPLYSSERHLLMTVSMTPKKQWRVRQYKIWGYQQLSFFARKTFSVEGRLGLRPGEPGM